MSDPPAHLRQNLEAALAGFAGQASPGAGARALLGVLGYASERRVEVGGVEAFIALLEEGRPLTKQQRQLLGRWRSVDIVFQITGEEIGENPGLFRDFDQGHAGSFLFVAADLDGCAWSRGELAEMMRAANRGFLMPVVLLFRHGGALTLAVVHRRTHKRDSSRDVLEKVTLVKDVRLAGAHRAHLDILAGLALPRLAAEEGVRNFDELHAAWERALDIEALNRRFYGELFAWFERAVARCRFPDDGAGPGNAERHVIRLVTRLLFIWFLKEKGLVPDELFTEDFARRALKRHKPESGDYYRACLQNLFFATLNTGIERRGFSEGSPATHRDFNLYRYRRLLADPDDFVARLKSVPFVNGGLFDCLDDFEGKRAGGRRIDAFTDNEAQGRDLHVPAGLFFHDGEGLIPLLRRYKFTVEENTPLDREVALDPELLGRAFENLLAAYNPETRATARKATGSYYTPRHIVDYMVGEALAAALAAKVAPADGDVPFQREKLGYLLDWEDACGDAGELFDADETRALVGAIAELRVLDPAAGSGAFPMGVLHRLTLALGRLDPENEIWEALQKKRATAQAGKAFDVEKREARDEELAEISRLFEAYRDSDFGRKLYLIQNGIFGVDVQPIACQIAKLRFFVSLAIEQERNDDAADNYGIRPLPNLETRFVAADALIGLEAGAQGDLASGTVSDLEGELRRVRERHFNARSRQDKRRLRKEDRRLRRQLADGLEKIGFTHAAAEAVARWNPYDQNARAGWFDPEYMFGIADGFDVVIGNPPYVRADFRDERHRKAREAILDSGSYETLWEKWDLFVPFMEKSFKLLRKGGVTSLIVSDAFGHAKYALKARQWFLRNALIERIDFFSRIKIFDAAVHNLSYLFRKADGADNEPLRRLHEPAFGEVTALSSGRQKDLGERAFFPEDLYRAPPAPTVPLGDLCYISVGMVVHAHERLAPGAFALQDVVSERKDARHPKPFVEGKHLDRWLPAANRWLEWGTERAPALFRRKAFDELFTPAEKIVAQRSPGPDPKACYDDGGIHFDASSVGFVRWCDLKGVRNRSIKKQARYPGEKDRQKFPHREELEKRSRRFSIKFLLGVMNSTAAQSFLRAHRRSNIHLYPDDWKKLPIPDIPPDAQRPVVALVDGILAAKGKDSDISNLERKIDGIVHSLYGFEKGAVKSA